MTLTMNQIFAMVMRTVRNPREGASEVLSLGIGREAAWLSVGLVVILSLILAEITLFIGSLSGDPADMLSISPIVGGFLQFSVLIATAGVAYLVGRAMGGTGSFPEALLLMTWLQFIMVCVQIIQILALLMIPPLGGIVFIAGLILFLWLLTNFVAELHGFRSLAQVFVMILVTAFAVAFFLSLALTLFGVTVPIETGSV